ncbi:MAG: TRAP transporter large permease subunit [Pseudomonadota bacterium]
MIVPIVLIVLALFGAPLFAVIAASALWGFYRSTDEGAWELLQIVPVEVYRIAEMPILLAIPLFTFAGYLLSESGAPRRLVRLSNALLGWLPGGLSVVALAACAFFTAFTGASGVTIIALGAILYPALQQAKYDDNFSLGLITTSGSLGLLFAPSLPLILYGIVAEVSIDQLFLAGIFPGLVMLLMLSLYSFWHNRHLRSSNRFSWREVVAAVNEAKWEIPLPIIVLGGIYSGYFAVSEAAAVTAVYVLVIDLFVLREVRLSQLPQIVRESMLLVGGILIILGVSLASTNYMIDAEIPSRLFEFVSQKIDSPLTFLLLLNIFLLVLGAILDIFSAIVLVVPLILPVAMGFDIHPVHLGIIFLANMQLGYVTPPVGLNLFIASYRFDESIMKIYASTLPFLLILLLSVLIITYWPTLSLALL